MERTIKVMLVDDEIAIRNIFRTTIPWSEFGMEVVGEAGSGIEALNEMERMNPDVILADIKMPFMDGIEFSKIVKKQNPELVIFIVTAYEEFDYVREALRVGVEDYLVKPIDFQEMEKKLSAVQKKILEKWEKNQNQMIIEMEPSERTVSRIQNYVKENYRDPELNVASIANAFQFNRSYLSRLYKKETGKLLIDYIAEVRMEIARKMAQKGEKMYLVAEKVGIPDAGYFGNCFKKYTGVSYREYQKKNERVES